MHNPRFYFLTVSSICKDYWFYSTP